jgi:hypothetical protein
MNADGTNAVKLTSSGGYDPSWSPKGEFIAYENISAPTLGEIWTVSPDGTNDTPKIEAGNEEGYSRPDAYPGGIAYTYRYSDIDGDVLSDVYGAGLTGDAGRYDDFPAVAPDQSDLAFSTTLALPGGGTGSSIYTVKRGNLGPGIAPSWQPLPNEAPSSFAHPRGATPLRISLVPAYQACVSANRTHGAPLAYPSCSPPRTATQTITFGVGDGTPPAAKSIGSVLLVVHAGAVGPPDDSDVEIRFSLTNVIKQSNLGDYTGELQARTSLRLTDKQAGVASTIQDFPFVFAIPCTATADTTIGGLCAVNTTADAVLPGSAAEGQRETWALDQVRVYDAGPDGSPGTVYDNQVVAVQGLFVP